MKKRRSPARFFVGEVNIGVIFQLVLTAVGGFRMDGVCKGFSLIGKGYKY